MGHSKSTIVCKIRHFFRSAFFLSLTKQMFDLKKKGKEKQSKGCFGLLKMSLSMQRKTGFHLCSSNHSTILKSDTKGLRWEKYICPLLCLSWSTFISKVLIFILSFEISCVYDMGRRRWQTWLIHPIVWSHYRRNKERKQPGHVYASILSYQGLGPINSQVCSHTHTYPPRPPWSLQLFPPTCYVRAFISRQVQI